MHEGSKTRPAAGARQAAHHGQARALLGDPRQQGFDRERIRVRQQYQRVQAIEIRHAADRDARLARANGLEVERVHLGVRQRRGPDRHAAVLQLATRAHHALSPAADESLRADALAHRRQALLHVTQVGRPGEYHGQVGRSTAQAEGSPARRLGERVHAAIVGCQSRGYPRGHTAMFPPPPGGCACARRERAVRVASTDERTP